jgi:putative transposase
MNKAFFNRHSNRKPGYDYADQGYYFITIAVENKRLVLGEIINHTLRLSHAGQIVNQVWLELIRSNNNLSSHGFVIMPNHLHLILQTKREDQHEPEESLSIGKIIRRFKGKICKLIHEIGLSDFKWQRNYYDHIIRSERSLKLIQLYIATNPILWNIDPENPKSKPDIHMERSLMTNCGFSDEDIDLIKNYVDYRIHRPSRAR